MITVDEYQNNILKSATYYGVSLFLGDGQFDSYTTRTLQEARDVGKQMMAHHRNGRKALVYAITAKGEATLVTE